ncbi:MAG: RIP metalloprotease RseP [Candidatus Edwardsbacteria bacterium]|nr:RIP metalloprotease RseP [Candidatus Edwardsbacteria bacterium]MBU1576512.1 RIP metalloprotease RseP [Candidatus Edwardsbacteria bacterium]MBU2462722.1 RIP metalloprotease RseP [Candidatus Edwardsbacteria bacterium]MBU2594416.1 RIP metalloprotease RseP [Candidatus Edwardsbacteria bacterium]
MITILATLFVLGIMVFVHELGHFYVAKKVGIRVLKFSLGFGPKLFGFKKGDTQYLISALPLGGYIKLDGEEAFEENYVAKPGDYMAAPWWGRVLMALAGPMANLLTAFLIFIMLGLVGFNAPDYSTSVGKVGSGSIAQQIGITEGDRIVSIDGKEVKTWHGMWQELQTERAADSLSLTLDRTGERIVLNIPSSQRIKFLENIEPAVPAQLGEVYPSLPAYQAGLNAGDIVLAIDSLPVKTWDGMREIINKNAGRETKLLIERGSDTFSVRITPVEQDYPGQGTAGVIGVTAPVFGSYKLRLGLWASIANATVSTGSLVARTYGVLYKIVVKPSSAKQLGGILMIGEMAGSTAKKGFSDLMLLVALLSISLMVLNLLPLPVLDGGVIFFSLLEGIRKKTLPVKVQVVIQQIGIAILIMLMLFTILNDGMKIFSRHSAVKKNSQQIEQAK